MRGYRLHIRRFQGVHKAYPACHLAIYEAVRNAKHITSEIIHRFCFGSACTLAENEQYKYAIIRILNLQWILRDTRLLFLCEGAKADGRYSSRAIAFQCSDR